MYKLFLLTQILTLVLGALSVLPINKNEEKGIETRMEIKPASSKWTFSAINFLQYRKNNGHEYIYEKVYQDDQQLSNFEYIDPNFIKIRTSELRKDEEVMVMINSNKVITLVDALKEVKEGDKIVIFPAYKKQLYKHIFNGEFWEYCLLKDTNFKLSAGIPWMINIYYYEKGSDELKSRTQPIYLPNTVRCNDKTQEISLGLHDPEKKIDIEKPIKLGKMIFFNGKLEESSRVYVVNKEQKPFWDYEVLKIPLYTSDNVGSRIFDQYPASGVEAKKIYYKSWIFISQGWSYNSGYYLKTHTIRYHLPINNIENQLISTKLVDKKDIEEFILSKYKNFGINMNFRDFKSMDIEWKSPDKLIENDSVVFKVKLANENKTYSFNILALSLKEKRELIEKRKIEEKAEMERIERIEIEEKKAEKERRKQIFHVEKVPKVVVQNLKNTNSVWEKISFKMKKSKSWINMKSMMIIGFAIFFLMILGFKIMKK